MAWVPMREITDSEVALLEKRALAFLIRHHLNTGGIFPSWCIAVETTLAWLSFGRLPSKAKSWRLRRLWRRIARRALREPRATGIIHGYIMSC